jgi:hypothetical protein
VDYFGTCGTADHMDNVDTGLVNQLLRRKQRENHRLPCYEHVMAGVTGDNQEYEPYLKALGAADTRPAGAPSSA